MKIGFWSVQIDIEKAFKDRGAKTLGLDFHKSDWQEDFITANCDAYVWYPHALHKQWFKLEDRAGFVELFLGKYAFPSLKTSYLFQDKMRQKYIFDRFKIPQPKTRLITSPEDLGVLSRIDLPVVVKDIWGYGGYGVKLISTKKELLKLKFPREESKITPKHFIYLQEFIDMKYEYRVVTVGDEIILSYKKESTEFLKHVWRGAEIIFDSNKKVINFVKRYNKMLQLDCCGWDIAEDKQGNFYVLELNPIFGTISLEKAGINLADKIADYVIKKLK